MSDPDATPAPDAQGESIARGTYDILRDRLDAHARTLRQRADALNQKRGGERRVLLRAACQGGVAGGQEDQVVADRRLARRSLFKDTRRRDAWRAAPR